MTENELNRLADLIAGRQNNHQSTKGSGVQRPRELDDPNTDPTLRAAILDNYTARIMDVPQRQWSDAEKRSVHEQAQRVLKGLGF